MSSSDVTKAYAKSIYALGKESGTDVAGELTTIQEAINSNNNLETLLFMEVFTIEEKQDVLNEIMGKLNSSSLTKNVMNFLLQENRMGIFPMIYKEIIVMDDHEKGFLRGTIEGNENSANEEFVQEVKSYLEKRLGKKTELDYVQNSEITAGYRVTVEDLQLDASVDNQLNKLKENILNS